MLSEETQNILARILLALAEGERNVEDVRKEIANEDNYDIQTIFKVLDSNGDNFITPKDLQNYLINHGLDVNFKEVKLLILLLSFLIKSMQLCLYFFMFISLSKF